ncbi:MAG: hypothetical protein HS111_05295 [Kofleriaceae bacterium]|nr:hypothetical protein [Kofleriaceae bacterium]MCL4228709.1 hypothetical protein [Myxococcales bacterium]
MGPPRLETLGFWFNERAPSSYPRPQALVGAWDPEARARVVAYLRAGARLHAFAGHSHCRFACGARPSVMGRRDLTDGDQVWPEGLAHYVEVHGVRLPERLVATALAHGGEPPAVDVAAARRRRYDDGPWLAWARAAGACLDLAGWELPDRDARARIAAELGADLEVVLCRADTRQVVIAHPAGALEIRQLSTGGHPPRHLPGWHAWPAAT